MAIKGKKCIDTLNLIYITRKCNVTALLTISNKTKNSIYGRHCETTKAVS